VSTHNHDDVSVIPDAPSSGVAVPTAMVFAPSTLLTVTIEQKGADDDVHLHAGGQGFWIARMLHTLGIDVTLCTTFGGESGVVIQSLIERAGIRVHAVAVDGESEAYVHDRRTGERVTVAEMRPRMLSRHEVDELYGAALVEGLEASVSVLAGTVETVVPDETFQRLAHDLQTNDRPVVADLSRSQLRAAVRGGVRVLKVSHTELEGWATGDSQLDLIRAMFTLQSKGAKTVVVSRADHPALVLDGDDVHQVFTPKLAAYDERGAGDSMTAGLAAGLARSLTMPETVCLSAAAGTLNVTRHGLGSGEREAIEHMAAQIELRPVVTRDTVTTPRVTVTTPDELASRAHLPGH
jgi:1-phosphofructokinase